MKLLHSAALAILVIFLTSSYLEAAPAIAPSPSGSASCDKLCDTRCKKASVHDRCLFYCGGCCKTCGCVPSGTYGNKDECPCYRDKLTKKGKSKCP